jgi:hypothetical protein
MCSIDCINNTYPWELWVIDILLHYTVCTSLTSCLKGFLDGGKNRRKFPNFHAKKKNKRKTKTKMKFVGKFRENIFNIFWFLDVKGHDFKSNSRSYTYHFMIHIIVGRAAVITMRWCYIIRDKKEENK